MRALETILFATCDFLIQSFNIIGWISIIGFFVLSLVQLIY